MKSAMSMKNARVSGVAGLLLAAGMAAPAFGIDRSWLCNSGLWSDASCWSPIGNPGPADITRIGNMPGVENNTVTMDQNDGIAGLIISDGMTLRTDGFRLTITGDSLVSGRNVVNIMGQPVAFESRLRVIDAGAGADLETVDLSIADEARVEIASSGLILAGGVVAVGGSATLDGDNGSLHLTGAGTTLVNSGRILADDGGFTIAQLGAGLYDLDGPANTGRLDLTPSGGARLSIVGAGLADPFSGDVDMVAGSWLQVAMTNGWTADSLSTFSIVGSPGGAVTRITGGAFEFAGTMGVQGADAELHIEADTTFAAPGVISVGEDNRVRVIGDAVIDGGIFILDEGARLDFDGATELNAGTLQSFSALLGQGAIYLNGPTEWAGTVTVTGIARQNGAASVTSPSIINADLFDMDGTLSPDWSISQSLTINADALDVGGNGVESDIAISAQSGRLTVNLDGPGESWIFGGEMTLGQLPGAAHILVTRVDGAPVQVGGAVSVPAGRVRISAPATFLNGADVHVGAAAAELRFESSVEIRSGVAFTGDGRISTGAGGQMVLKHGVGTGGVGLLNTGTLRVENGPGLVSVDRFENSGTWQVELGGYAAGAAYDRLAVSGSASAGGAIEVQLINGFVPVVGDSFTVLTTAGGVSGSFAPTAVTSVGDVQYEWSVTTNPSDVVVRLERVSSSCSADYNVDGVANSQDFFDFLADFFALSSNADITGDGVINSQDFFDFLTEFFKGCA